MIIRLVQLKLDHFLFFKKMHERQPVELKWLVIMLDLKVSKEGKAKQRSVDGWSMSHNVTTLEWMTCLCNTILTRLLKRMFSSENSDTQTNLVPIWFLAGCLQPHEDHDHPDELIFPAAAPA